MLTTICLASARDGLRVYELVLGLLSSSHPSLQSQQLAVNNKRSIVSVVGHLPTFSRLLLLDERVDFGWWVQNEVVLGFRSAGALFEIVLLLRFGGGGEKPRHNLCARIYMQEV